MLFELKMPTQKELTSFLDHGVWISDDRVSALASLRSGGIEQIDFHGEQPVSRNAKLLYHPDGVLKFELLWQAEGKLHRKLLDWQNLTIHPFSIEQVHDLVDFEVVLQIAVKKNQLAAQCKCFPKHQGKTARDLRFHVLWNQQSRTREVHGERLWADLPPKSGTIALKATDQIHLWPWLQRQGDYQGDFLIPENWRRMFFKRDCVSGTARKEDLKNEFVKTNLKLYDADTFILIGNAEYACLKSQQAWQVFDAGDAEKDSESLIFPTFTVQFFTRKPGNGAAVPSTGIWKAQSERYHEFAKQTPKLRLPGFPGVETFFEQMPQVVESAKVQDFGMTRACPGTYYWIWSWDNMVTAQAMARFGDLETMRRMVVFLHQHRDIDGAIPGRWTRQLEAMDSRKIGGLDFLFCELVMQLYAETLDRSVLQNNYAVLHHAFRAIAQSCDDQGRFLTMGMYPDLPTKMARSGQDYVAIDTGMWYCFCRNMEKIALLLQDDATANVAIQLADALQGSFLPLFWDGKKGFCCDSVYPDSDKINQTYPLFSLLFMEFPFGQSLLHSRMADCGDFIEKHLLGDDGIRITPTWDKNHTSEPVMSAWYPHWDLPATTVLARAGRKSALQSWLNSVEQAYQTLGYCPEFVALDVPAREKFRLHGAAWHLNCASGWYNSLIHNIVGLAFDLGGITAMPIDAAEASLQNLCFRGGRWDVQIKGRGKWLQRMLVDNIALSGTSKVPTPFYNTDRHELTIELGDDLPVLPVLTELWGGSVLDAGSGSDRTECRIYGLGRVDFAFVSKCRPRLLFDNRTHGFNWNASRNEGRGQFTLSGEHQIQIITAEV